MDKKILKFLLGIGVLLLPFAFKRKKLTEWFLVFFIKGYISSILATIMVEKKKFYFPVRFKPKIFKISIVFDYLLFPLLCVFFNRTTLHSKPIQIFFQAFFYSLPMTIIEAVLERFTKLIKYNKGWTWFTTLWALMSTFLFVRLFMAIIRKLNIEED